MVLQELEVGEELELNIKWGGRKYELKSKVEIVDADSVLINPYTYGGNTVDFSSSSFRGIVIDVIAKNHNGKRYKWPAVNVSTVKRFGRSYYLINTSDYKKLAKESERRNQDRVKIGLRCVLSIYGDDGMYYGIIKDISQGGVAFIPEMDIAYEGKLIELQFADSVRGHEFQIRFKIRVVRKDMEDGKILYGCRIVEAQRDALAYLYLKTVDSRSKKQSREE